MKMHKTLLGAVAMILLAAACKKDKPVEQTQTPAPGNTSGMSTFFVDNQASFTQNFTVDASTWNTVVGAEGMKFYIPPNALVDGSGNTVSGNVNMTLLEVLDAKSMILTNMPTTSNNQMLVSGGEFKIEFTQNGNPLFLAPGMSIPVYVPTNAPDPSMSLFAGVNDMNGDFEDWIPADSLNLNDSVNIVQDSSGGNWSDYYYFDLNDTDFGWMNCDYFYGSGGPLTTVSAGLPAGHDYTNTNAFLHVAGTNSLFNLSIWDATDEELQSYANSIPENLSCTIVVISEINGQFYSAFVPITVLTNHVENVTLNATTYAQLLLDLDNL